MRRTPLSVLCCLLLSLPAAHARNGINQIERTLWETRSFLAAHPDVAERKRGFWHLERGELPRALDAFRKAARYADKPSMAMLAELYWEGRHISADRALAYAWMDLAAERGYPAFVARRERFWAGLDDAARARALEVGEPLYAEYGDAVAKPRMETLLDRARLAITGSRVGFVGPLSIAIPHNGGWLSFDGSTYYQARFWRPERYFAFTDTLWSGWPQGDVTVGAPVAGSKDE